MVSSLGIRQLDPTILSSRVPLLVVSLRVKSARRADSRDICYEIGFIMSQSISFDVIVYILCGAE